MLHRIKHRVVHHARRAKHHLWNAFIPHPGNDHRPHALRHKALTGYAIAIIVVKVVVSGFLVAYPGPSATSNLTPSNIISLTNKARTQNKLKILRSNAKLSSAAQAKGNDMLSKGYFAHISPTNVTPWYWFKRAGYQYSYAGENLAMDFLTAEEVTKAWMASPGHRKNILSSRYLDIGVAVVSGKLKGVQTTIVVQFFGAPAVIRQQPTQVAKVTPPPPTTPTKVSTVQQQSQQTPPPPPPPAPEPVQPLKPKITSPVSDTVLATRRPWIAGESEAGLLVYLYSNGQNIGQATADAKGYFSFQPNSDLPEGKQTLTAIASRDAVTSEPSLPIAVNFDTDPPSASIASLIVLPSSAPANGYTVSGTIVGQDVAEATVRLGSSEAKLPVTSGAFSVAVAPQPGDAAGNITLRLRDTVGNVSIVPVASLSFLNVEIVRPQNGWLSVVPKVLLYSRRFFVTLWLFVFLILAVNVLVKVRIHHHATVVYSLLLLYGLTIIMMTT